SPEQGSRKGKLHFILHGDKLKGEWVLVRGSRQPNEWIFFKVRDQYASTDAEITETRPESVISGARVEDLSDQTKPTRHWFTPLERELEKHGMKAAGRTPIPKAVQPMLATLSDKPFSNEDWIFELKLDGVRAIVVKNAGKLDMWTRNEKSMTNRFPTLANAI